MAAPLAIRLTPRHPRTLVGEGILFDLGIHITTALQLETPELNRDRTSIHIKPRTEGAKAAVLTGADYMRLHHAHPLSQIGQTMPVDAGREWTVELNLFHYTAALPAGKYAIAMQYRYGKTAAETVSSNAVEIEVSPVRLASANYRWFGGAEPRETLGSVWVGLDGQQEQWFYQVANRRNPGAVETAVRLGMPARKPGAHPVLAHLNDIQAMHFRKFMVWEQDGEVGVQPVHASGRGGDPRFAKHGLHGGARLVDPPLQLHHGGLLALLTGTGADGKPACSLVSFPEEGEGSSRLSPLTALPDHTTALWPADERAPAMFAQLPGGKAARVGGKSTELFGGRIIDALDLSQWMGNGTLIGYFHESGRVHPFAVDSQKATALSSSGSYESARLGKFAGLCYREPAGVSLLFAVGTGWAVLDGGQLHAVPGAKGADAPPALLPAGKALYIVQHHSERGFLALMVGSAPPEALI